VTAKSLLLKGPNGNCNILEKKEFCILNLYPHRHKSVWGDWSHSDTSKPVVGYGANYGH
jgi:hypothetical protein